MSTLFIILITIVSILLILVILVRSPKGSALGSAFGGGAAAGMLGGVKRTSDFLEKATWVLVSVLFGLVLLMNVMVGGGTAQSLDQESLLNQELDNSAPVFQTPASPIEGLDLSE